MKIIKSLKEIRSACDRSEIYVTIGNFDGVHRGHSGFIHQIRDRANQSGAKLVVITFVPHPIFVLKPSKHFLISTYEERRSLLENLGIDYLYEIQFDRDFSTLSPDEFLNQYILVDDRITDIFLGHDFVFGTNKSGDHDIAKEICTRKNVNLTILDKFFVDETRVSSSLIRNAIISGDVTKAATFLGRNFHLTGTVIKGVGRGHQLGFATANIDYSNMIVLPKRGVYVTRTIYNGIIYHSITNVGLNPTFEDVIGINVETHILDFNRDIYGEIITVSFIKRLRDEMKFKSEDDLIAQIENDILLVNV